ncbi:hypothetical protein, partial [Mucilaginibacter arboris]|uniref:hypothetical protein n=1 Tax=Mucilaginibacter arboris TaxID=2682090 RepID=UPI001E4BFAA4
GDKKIFSKLSRAKTQIAPNEQVLPMVGELKNHPPRQLPFIFIQRLKNYSAAQNHFFSRNQS